MKAHVWLLTRLVAALFWAVVLGALVYWVVFPTIISIGYRVAGTKLDRFGLQGGEGAAGSEDWIHPLGPPDSPTLSSPIWVMVGDRLAVAHDGVYLDQFGRDVDPLGALF